MRSKILIVFIFLFFLVLGSGIYISLRERSAPSYIQSEYALGKKESTYLIKQSDDVFSLEITNMQGKKGEFLVKNNRDFKPFVNKKVFVQGRYILEDNKVKALIEDITINEGK